MAAPASELGHACATTFLLRSALDRPGCVISVLRAGAVTDAAHALSALSAEALSSGTGWEVASACFDLGTELWHTCPGVLLVRHQK